MAKILQNAHKIEILEHASTLVEDLLLIEKAGRTCYASEKNEITQETAERFIKRLIKSGHESVLEHIPLTYDISNISYSDLAVFLNNTIGAVFARPISLTHDFIISMNLRTLRDALTIIPQNKIASALGEDILSRIPWLLEDKYFSTSKTGQDCKIRWISQQELNGSPREDLIYLTIKFSGISRGLTHELVRHRLCSYSQRSTRYVDESSLGLVVPPDSEYSFWQEEAEALENMYSHLRKSGEAPEDARQVLPTGVTTEIVTSARLSQWKYILRLRTAKAAHWEIRAVMCDLYEELIQRYPTVFSGLLVRKEWYRGAPYFSPSTDDRKEL